MNVISQVLVKFTEKQSNNIFYSFTASNPYTLLENSTFFNPHGNLVPVGFALVNTALCICARQWESTFPELFVDSAYSLCMVLLRVDQSNKFYPIFKVVSSQHVLPCK